MSSSRARRGTGPAASWAGPRSERRATEAAVRRCGGFQSVRLVGVQGSAASATRPLRWPRFRLVSAAAALITASDWMKRRPKRCPLIGKFSNARWLWAPQRAFRAEPAEEVLLETSRRFLWSKLGLPFCRRAAMRRAEEVLDYWFGARDSAEYGQRRKMWFEEGRSIDVQLRERFLPLHEEAASGALDEWRDDARACLALVLLLDQFPRNSFRGTPRMYATDAAARRLDAIIAMRSSEQVCVVTPPPPLSAAAR